MTPTYLQYEARQGPYGKQCRTASPTAQMATVTHRIAACQAHSYSNRYYVVTKLSLPQKCSVAVTLEKAMGVIYHSNKNKVEISIRLSQ